MFAVSSMTLSEVLTSSRMTATSARIQITREPKEPPKVLLLFKRQSRERDRVSWENKPHVIAIFSK